MKFVIYTISFSPHQTPLSNAMMAEVGMDECRYVSAAPVKAERRIIGWGNDIDSFWHIKKWEKPDLAHEVSASSRLLLTGERDLPLMEERCCRGLETIYSSERWFKPRGGMLRLLSPRYFKMAQRFVQLLANQEALYYYPMGIHAARDMARLCGLLHGDIRCLFCPPELEFEGKPGGRIWLKRGGNQKKYCLDKMRMWGYYVEPTKLGALPVQEASKVNLKEIKVLWVGRLLKLKRVDTIVRAVREHANLKRVNADLPKITLDIYGVGPEEKRLRKIARRYEDIIRFYPPIPIAKVRQLMREHDVYVMASNGCEGWGAVVSEAIEEGMKVLGTYEAGSSATILPSSNLFKAGDWKRLSKLLREKIAPVGAFDWSAQNAAHYLKTKI